MPLVSYHSIRVNNGAALRSARSQLINERGFDVFAKDDSSRIAGVTANASQTILVTGATGFVGKHVCTALEARGHTVRRITRSDISGNNVWKVADLATTDIPAAAFQDVDTIVHLAASLPGHDPGAKTAEIARRVAKGAQTNGVDRIVHLSSIAARIAAETPEKQRDYGAQKLEAERVFADFDHAGPSIVTLRPPVIYGPGARGSFATLCSLVRRGVPLPLGAATAQRSYLSMSNLSALILCLVEADQENWTAANGLPFEPHDGAPVSTKHLVEFLAQEMELTPKLFSIPPPVLRLLGKLTSKGDQVAAVFDPLTCHDTPSLLDCFGWRPHEQMPESLSFLKDNKS